MIIDIHGHYTTAPKALEAWRKRQIDALADPAAAPKASDLVISDDDLRETIEANQLKKMDERGIDLTVFSPRASFMAHHIGDFATSAAWAAISNELGHRVARLTEPDSSHRGIELVGGVICDDGAIALNKHQAVVAGIGGDDLVATNADELLRRG